MLPSGRELQFTSKKYRFSPVEILSVQGKGFEHQFTGINKKNERINYILLNYNIKLGLL